MGRPAVSAQARLTPADLKRAGANRRGRVTAAGIYVAVMVGVIIAWNANADSAGTAFSGTAFLVWSVASALCGWIIRHPLAMLLPLLAIPLAAPFGYAEQWLGSDAPLISLVMVFEAPIQVAIVGIGFGGRLLYERGRRALAHRGAQQT
jgi:hypothetical protein